MTMIGLPARIDGDQISLVFSDGGAGAPQVAYLGPRLSQSEDLSAITAAAQFGLHEAQPNVRVAPSLFPQVGTGFLGSPAALIRRGDRAVVTAFELTDISIGQARAGFQFEDKHNGLSLSIEWRIASGDVVVTRASLTNKGSDRLAIDHLASLSLPLPDWAIVQSRFSGRWSHEMGVARAPIAQGETRSHSRGGKQGFGGGNWLMVGSANADADTGKMIAAHLLWSGDYQSVVERDADGAAMLQLGVRLDAGEIILGAGESYHTPDACFAFSNAGRNGLRRAFHTFARADILPAMGPRKVHINSWDALGFDLDEARLMAFAQTAAQIGIERFVVDDGWFSGRSNDRTSLGDWSTDRARFPRGLNPLIAHVEKLGMDFGLWVEPEMVSADSDLYRAHPDWCLNLPMRAQPEQRQQLVLDLTQPEVCEYLFSAIDRLLGDHAVAYLKWDHNRDLFPAANANGPVGHAQTIALYALLDHVRAAHPHVEIESCSSGGGRVDYAIMERCHRFWASDNNHPVDRLRINNAWSQFFPLEVIGTHVGPPTNPITGRSAPIDFRAKVAMFGHMGVEADPTDIDQTDRETLAAIIALYKDWRGVLHTGLCEELSCDTPDIWAMVVRSPARSIALVAQTQFAAAFHAQRIYLPGFEAAARYRVTLPAPWPNKARWYLNDANAWRSGLVMSGQALAFSGLAIPLTHPDTAWLISAERID